MKKLLFVLAVATFAACNSGETTNGTDSLTNKVDSAADAKIDAIQSNADSLSNKIDSSAGAQIDSLKAKGDSTKK